MRLKRITVKAFRGFRDEVTIPLDSSFVLVYGLNGSGKSSLTEALEWLFFDEISRQRLSRCRSEYQYEEYIKNLFYPGPDTPFVEVSGEIEGRDVTVRKELLKGGKGYYIDGVKVDDLTSLGLKLESYFRPMLAQTEIKALVDTEQKDRWEQLASILGQDDLTRLRDHLINLRSNKRDETFRRQEARHAGLIDELKASTKLSVLQSALEGRRVDNTLSAVTQLLGIPVTDIPTALELIRGRLKGLLSTELGQRIANVTFEDFTSLEAFFSGVIDVLASLQKLTTQSVEGGHDLEYIDFLAKGKPFILIDTCPFCKADALSPGRVSEIDAMLAESRRARIAKTEYDDLLGKTATTLGQLRSTITRHLPGTDALRVISQKLGDMGETKLGAHCQTFAKDINAAIGEISTGITDAVKNHNQYLEHVFFHKQADDKAKLEAPAIAMTRAKSSAQSLLDEWSYLKAELSERVPTSSENQQEEIKRWLLIERVVIFFDSSASYVQQAQILALLDNIRSKLEVFEKAEVQRLLEEHADEIKTYYSKLNRGEKIQFAGIEVKGGARRQAKLKAEAFGRDVNPVTFFSEAHTNSLALSIYFPQRVDRNDTWQVVVLDDPVQSMDENHSQALIEILDELANRKQVIVLTHSKSFFKRLRVRVGHRKPLVYQFFNNEANGPKIQVDAGETLAALESVSTLSQKGDTRSLEMASSFLRKAIEAFCVDYLLEKGVSFTKTQRILKNGFSDLFAACESAGLPASETSKLKSLLDNSSADSHAWSLSDTTKGGLMTGHQLISDMYHNFVQ